MDFNEFQREAEKTAIYPDRGVDLTYPTLGLCSEAGELAGKVKKIIRDKGGVALEADRAAIAHELGDVLWYVADLAGVLGYNLERIAQLNIAKLADRAERGALGGDGDER